MTARVRQRGAAAGDSRAGRQSRGAGPSCGHPLIPGKSQPKSYPRLCYDSTIPPHSITARCHSVILSTVCLGHFLFSVSFHHLITSLLCSFHSIVCLWLGLNVLFCVPNLSRSLCCDFLPRSLFFFFDPPSFLTLPPPAFCEVKRNFLQAGGVVILSWLAWRMDVHDPGVTVHVDLPCTLRPRPPSLSSCRCWYGTQGIGIGTRW